MVQGKDGNFYGITTIGGSSASDSSGTALGSGTVFQLTPEGGLTTYHRFDAGGRQGVGPLVQTADGSLDGVTVAGGPLDQGSIFNVTLDGAVSTIHFFNATTEGYAPNGPLVLGGNGIFYGTIMNIPTGNYGGIYSVTADGTVTPFPGITDGWYPNGGLVLSKDGTLVYGTTQRGGVSGGTLFSLNLATGAETILQDFGSFFGEPGGTGGPWPNAGLIASADGTVLYGTTSEPPGTVFSFNLITNQPTTLHAFVYFPSTGEGTVPSTGLTLGTDGNLYGTTSYTSYNPIDRSGISYGHGTIYRITPDGVLTPLHIFAADGSEGGGGVVLVQARDGNLYGFTGKTLFSLAPDGTFTNLGSSAEFSGSPPIQATDGNLYGVTLAGGTDGAGAIYRVTLDLATVRTAPLISNAAAPAGQVGTAYSYQITASHLPTSFTATGLPLGLSVDAAIGLISGTPTVSGRFAIALSATNAAGSGTDALTLTIASPTVTLTATVPEIAVDGGQAYAFLLTLSSAPTSDIEVAYTVKGNATPGEDYIPLKGMAKVKAGKTSKVIKVTPEGDLGGASKKTVKLLLEPGTGYVVGTTGKVKVTILSAGR